MLRQFLDEFKTMLDLEEKVRRLCFYWALWNAKSISDKELIDVISKTFSKETQEAWLEYVGKKKVALDEDNPLRALMI